MLVIVLLALNVEPAKASIYQLWSDLTGKYGKSTLRSVKRNLQSANVKNTLLLNFKLYVI